MIILLRVILVAALIAIWHKTQSWIGARGQLQGDIGDLVHQWMTPLHRFLVRSPGAVSALLITSSLGIDLLGLAVLGWGIFGPSLRPLLGLILILFLRQGAQYATALPAPPGMIWRYPGFPSLFVTYHVENDLFFSGHTALAVYGSLTLCQLGNPALSASVIALAIYEVLAVLALRAHWTMDVYAGAVTAWLCFEWVR